MPIPECVLEITIQRHLNLVSVEHSGAISWEELQQVKNVVWGEQAVAVEIFPDQEKVVNSGNYRHLWKLGAGDFVPDLMSEFGTLDNSHGPSLEKVYRAGEAADTETLQ